MGTRGKFGFFYKGKYYICYNNYDSYPSSLGVHLILELIRADLDEWIKLLENITEVSEDIKPTPEDIEKLEKYTDLTVSDESTEDWYCLLKMTQGSFYRVLHSGYMENVHDVPKDEEYIYVLDLDEKVFRAQGRYDAFDLTIKLETEELIKCAIEWSKGGLDEDYDPEKELVKLQERVKERLIYRKELERRHKGGFREK